MQRDDVMRIAEKIVRVMEVPLTLADGAFTFFVAACALSVAGAVNRSAGPAPEAVGCPPSRCPASAAVPTSIATGS